MITNKWCRYEHSLGDVELWEQHVENHSYLHGEDAWEAVCFCACNKMCNKYPKYIYV